MFCPRCDKDEGIKFFEAPQDRSWELYRCRYCDFIWRSTEKDYIKNKDAERYLTLIDKLGLRK